MRRNVLLTLWSHEDFRALSGATTMWRNSSPLSWGPQQRRCYLTLTFVGHDTEFTPVFQMQTPVAPRNPDLGPRYTCVLTPFLHANPIRRSWRNADFTKRRGAA